MAPAAVRMARELSADAVLVFTETGQTYRLLRQMVDRDGPRVVAATLNPSTFEELRSSGAPVIRVPASVFSRIGEIQQAISAGLREGVIRRGELLVCLIGPKPGSEADTLFIHSATGTESVIAQLVGSSPVVDAVIELSTQIGREGMEGRPVGTSFTVGDEARVMELSEQIGINPFKGHEISVLDRRNWYLIKRYSLACEGAFVVDSNGVILAADRYLRAENAEIDLPSGLGTRHRAVARVTKMTRAVGVVVSEGDRRVRVFKEGRMVGELNPMNEVLVE